VLELGGGAADADASAIRTTIPDALQPPALVWLVGPRTKQCRVSVKVFRWADGSDAAPIHSDRLNPDQESAQKRFAKALAKVEPQTDIDEIAQRLVALNIPPDDNENSQRKQSARVRHDAPAPEVANKDLPVVLLPGCPVPIQESAEQLGKLLAPGERYFVRGGAIVTFSRDEAGQHILDTVKPAALASVFETVAKLMNFGKCEGELDQQPAVCSEQQAKLIQHCEAFQHAFPPLRLLSACPVLIERDGSLVQICGYDRDSGIMALATPADDVSLDDAVDLLLEMLADYRFATPADRARAIAAVITPGMVMGGLLGGRVPVDLGAVFAVIRAWHQAGKPKSAETRHDFRPWARTMDWIVQNIFRAGPILDGHRETQVRMATPALNWLRDVALAVRDAGQLDAWLRAAQLADILAESSAELPGLPDGGAAEDEDVRKKILQAIGRRLGQCFRQERSAKNDGFEIERREYPDSERRRTIREYCFRVPKPGPDECAYAPPPQRRGIGANLPIGDAEDGSPASDDTDQGLDDPVCGFGAPIAAPIGAPNTTTL
jgi:hypothetical protein